MVLERGELEAGGAGGGGIEVGSRARIRVSCPDGLYSHGADDYNGTLSEIIPAEFELEARDCLLVED